MNIIETIIIVISTLTIWECFIKTWFRYDKKSKELKKDIEVLETLRELNKRLNIKA